VTYSGEEICLDINVGVMCEEHLANAYKQQPFEPYKQHFKG